MSNPLNPNDRTDLHTNFRELFTAYLAAALWSSTDDDGVPLDAKYDYGNFEPETMEALEAFARVFYARHACYIEARIEKRGTEYADGGHSIWEQAGHDLWLTQNGHGAGFWDRPEELWGPYADMFTKAAKALGEIDLYVGDDRRLYV